ncbi:MAG: 1-deoxy-D-xylulose-5-phosphate reductoisomerase [[Clostridium] fimetarium]|nr:1-deoxy-D-xylulose-5-phosphate reductoisomerase [Alistipes timonensis]MCM1406104.1 1-deoxy-D-xylulose-5-phosphate reductoisomerase [[Clostridium] fimetarium]
MNTAENQIVRPKRVAVLGSTGSIGVQTLDVIAEYPGLFKAEVLIAGSRVDNLIEQARRVRPSWAIIVDESKYPALKEALEPLGIRTASGQKAVDDIMEADCFDTVVTATVGYSGLAPTLRAIAAGKEIALANKETLVVAGDLVTERLASSRSVIYPVDSEHSAIFQCLRGEAPESVKRLIITASGGPFRTWSKERIALATPADALRHPNWDMGAKITIDSASMMNKAFEIIEARWLFGVKPEQISAVVHPQSIIHSMVEFTDGAIKAQLGVPDMRLPIAYALADARRFATERPGLSIADMANLTFEEPDPERFPCFSLGHYALNRGGNTACVINAANEIAVAAFLRGELSFPGIYDTISETLAKVPFIARPGYDEYVACNAEARAVAASLLRQPQLAL